MTNKHIKFKNWFFETTFQKKTPQENIYFLSWCCLFPRVQRVLRIKIKIIIKSKKVKKYRVWLTWKDKI
jgi:hypothetical protein